MIYVGIVLVNHRKATYEVQPVITSVELEFVWSSLEEGEGSDS